MIQAEGLVDNAKRGQGVKPIFDNHQRQALDTPSAEGGYPMFLASTKLEGSVLICLVETPLIAYLAYALEPSYITQRCTIIPALVSDAFASLSRGPQRQADLGSSIH